MKEHCFFCSADTDVTVECLLFFVCDNDIASSML